MGATGLSVVSAALSGHLELADSADGLTPWRLPAAARRHAPEWLTLMAEFASGERLTLRTDADTLAFDVSLVRLVMRHLGHPAAPARFVAVADGVEIVTEVDDTGLVTETPDGRLVRGRALRSTVRIDLGTASAEREVVVWLPHDAGVTFHDVRASRHGAPTAVAAAAPPARLRWLHHGSSISHGGTATLPTGTWPVRAAARLGVDVVNLGFGGNAMLDPMTARGIAAAPADVITLKIGVNIVGGDTMRRRAFLPALHGFVDLVREGHPDTPIVLVTAIGCPAIEHAPGPIRAGADGRVAGDTRTVVPGDGTLTLSVTRDLIAEAVADRADDAQLMLLDGRALLRPEEAHLLPDGLHPGDAGYALMAERFALLVRNPQSPPGRAFAAAGY